MCGIAGSFSFEGAASDGDVAAVGRMIDGLRHRGPDGSGVTRCGAVVLGHRRLSVIDLSADGRQPMANEDGTVWLTFNGEIYNFRDLRRRLLDEGHRFRSQTDSETLLHGYEQWGMEGVLERARGMFAFALFDSRPAGGELFLVRDRFGIKPLYYWRDGRTLRFASEVRALGRAMPTGGGDSPEALCRFLQLGSIPEPLTTRAGVFSLPAGGFAEVEPSGMRIRSYFRLPVTPGGQASRTKTADLAGLAAGTRRILEETVALHLVSDAPLGIFLSGGVDSSALVALARTVHAGKLTTVSVVFDEADLSEARYARQVSEKFSTRHHEFRLRQEQVFQRLEEVFLAMDQPTIDGFNTYFVSEAARQTGLKVVLSGLGADETFMGYRHFHAARRMASAWRAFSSLPGWGRAGIGRLLRAMAGGIGKDALRRSDYLADGSRGLYLLYRGLFSSREVADLLGCSQRQASSLDWLEAPPPGLSLCEAIALHEFRHYLRNQLLRDTDSMSMSHSLEARVPFLDHVLVEHAFGLPEEAKFSRSVNKPALVRALGEDLPREIWDRPKMGFTLPFGEWLRSRRLELAARCRANPRLNSRAVDRVWTRFAAGRTHWSRPWALLVASALE